MSEHATFSVPDPGADSAEAIKEALRSENGGVSIADGLTYGDDGPAAQPRDNQGQFAGNEPAAPEPAAPAPATTPAEPAAVEPPAAPLFESDDPLLQGYLERFGGNLEEALKSAAHQTDLLGRQANEVGELRKAVEELRQAQTAAPAEPANQPAPLMIPQQHEVDYIEDTVASRGGELAAVEALQAGREDLARVAVRAWAAQDDTPDAAMDFWGRYQAAKAQLAQEAAPAPAPAAAPAAPAMELPPEVNQMIAEQRAKALGAEIKALAGEQFEALAPHIQESFNGLPDAVKAMATSQSAEERATGLGLVLDIARGRAGAGLAVTAAAQQHQRVVAGKQSAALVSGGLRPVSPAASPSALGYDPDTGPLPDDMPAAERSKIIAARLSKALKETTTTSVQDGLTYGS